MDRNTYLLITHGLGDVTQTFANQEDWDPQDNVRQHLFLLCFNTPRIRVFRLVIVTDQEPKETDNWRQVPRPKNYVVTTHERPEIVITLLVSRKFENKLITLSSVSLSATSGAGLCVLHDRTYLLEPDINRLEFSFGCTGAYVTLTSDEFASLHIRRLISTMRILPIRSAIQQPSHSLPAGAIQQIGIELIIGVFDVASCARVLTSCALVCRGWYTSGVHDLLWSCFIPSGLYMNGHSFRKLVGCVERYPWLGERLLMLPRPRFDHNKAEEFISSYAILIKAATNLRHLDLMVSQWDEVRSHLTSLQHIEDMNLHVQTLRAQRNDTTPPKLYDVLSAINKWTCLKELSVGTWKLEPNGQIPESGAAYELRKLTLSGARFGYGRQASLSLEIVKHLISRPSSLECLTISSVEGLSQEDFKVIFSLIKSTIVDLCVNNCTLRSNSDLPGETEERAFDAVVDEMPHLNGLALNVNGQGLTSSLGILRKKPRDGGLSGTFEASWMPSPNDRMRDLENALKETGWKQVNILVEWNSNYSFSVARKIALGRGIAFSVSFG